MANLVDARLIEESVENETRSLDGTIDTTCDKVEIREWIDVNRRLRRNGLSSVRVFAAPDVKLNSGRYVSLDIESSQSLRLSVLSLITEVERKDNMIQEMSQTNSQLREEVNQLAQDVEAANIKARDIKVMLECSRARVQELEEEHGRYSSHFADEGERLRNTKSVVNTRCRQLEARLEELEKETSRLRRENYNLLQEEERRNKRQNQVFMELRHRAARLNSAMDQRLLDVIDSYESQIQDLVKELEVDSTDRNGRPRSEATSSASHGKGLLRSYEKQLRERDRKIRMLEEEKENAKQDLGSRPEHRDYRLLAQRVKKLEKLLSHHNISIPGEKSLKDPFERRKKFSSCLEDLDYLPAHQCHEYLRAVCEELETDNLDCLVGILQEMKEDGNRMDRFQQYCKELSDIVESLDDGNSRSRMERDSPVALSESNMRYYLEVVDNWRKDIAALTDLQDILNKLLDKTVAWTRAHVTSDHSVSDMVELLERVVHADKTDHKMTLTEDVSRSTLESIVSHFQTLFDVPKISGVFPRMNQIYRVLGEAKNVQTTLKNLLGLPADAASSVLVDSVGHLCHMRNSTTAKQLKKLLQTDDLNGVIRRLDEHTKFFPAFKGIMIKLFDILGVDQMDEVIPAVRALKLLAK